ncbi:glutamate carboxypeptidase [Sphingomonas sp.]|uniref:glutamate carboxypeptidase n=1 Tax=Sphingomonas sp. TaxID=28214 RepID=UPI00260128F0|nr:glutamate carboxypeptidase [Sphingomonas sp.]
MRYALLATLPCLLIASPTPAAERAQSRALRPLVEKATPEALALLERLVNIDTGTGDLEGWSKASDVVTAKLKALGMELSTVPAEQAGLPDNIVARIAGSGRGRILIIAHMDTVFEPGTAAKRPYRVAGDRAYGPGVSDEKAGLVTAIAAIGVLRQAGFRDFGQITLLIDSSEEKGSIGSRQLIARLAREHEVTLSMEPGQNPDSVVVWRKGTRIYTITVKGRAAHAGVAPQDGRNAAEELLNQLQQLETLPRSGDGLTANLTILQAGSRVNIIPDQAFAKLNVRARDKKDFDRVDAAVRAAAARPRIADTSITVSVENGAPPLPPNPRSDALGAMAIATYAEIGRTLGADGNGGASESAVAFEAGSAVLDGLGPIGDDFHSDKETLHLDTVGPRIYLLARLLQRLGAAPGTGPN